MKTDNSKDVQASAASDHWHDDLLQRRDSAQYLYKLIEQRFKAYHSKPDSEALCVALEADWGAGKTFFVKRLSQDLRNNDHAVVHFDAWANDLSDDPLVGFLAELQRNLKPYIEKMALAPQIAEVAQQKLRDVVQNAGRAAVPALAVVGKAILKKTTGIVADDLIDAVTKDEDFDAKQASDVASKAMEKFFEIALKQHRDKQTSIKQFKSSLESLMDYLEEHTQTRAPFFVFIDELDRCRPDYAIRLLEGIKHLFNVRGVCFIVSTNLRQLSASVKAIYGETFDGYRYLKKFFSFEYGLPRPEYTQFAQALITNSLLQELIISDHLKLVTGLPPTMTEKSSVLDRLTLPFAFVAEGMELDPRSQRQVFQLAEAAIVGFEKGRIVVAVYLFFLCSVYHRDPAQFALLMDSDGLAVGKVPASISVGSTSVKHTVVAQHRRHDAITPLRELLDVYSMFATMAKSVANKHFASMEEYNFPAGDIELLRRDVIEIDGVERLFLSMYPRLVRSAGYVRTS